MTQIATVTKMLGTGMAEVAVARQSACGHDCESCGGCGTQKMRISVRARTDLALSAGDRVELYSDNRVLGFAALVYLLPVVLFFVGYLALPFSSEGIRYCAGGVGFAFGIALAMVCDRMVRRKNSISYQIVRKL